MQDDVNTLLLADRFATQDSQIVHVDEMSQRIHLNSGAQGFDNATPFANPCLVRLDHRVVPDTQRTQFLFAPHPHSRVAPMPGNKGVRQAKRGFFKQDIARLENAGYFVPYLRIAIKLAAPGFNEANGIAEHHTGKIDAFILQQIQGIH